MIPKTQTILLEELKSPRNETAWQDFYQRYHPILLSFAKRQGLGDEDANDAASETLMVFVRRYGDGHYDRSRGRLRSWLFGIAENCILGLKRNKARQKVVAGDSAIVDIGEPGEMKKVFDQEWRKFIVDKALSLLAEETKTDLESIKIFQLRILKELPAKEVAERLGKTEQAVNTATHRINKRLADIIRQLKEDY